jgi:hypothetical protein
LQDLAVAIAGGGSWLGKGVVKQAKVLLVDLELIPHYLNRRIQSICDDSGEAGKRAPEHLAVLPWRHVSLQDGATPARILTAIEEQAATFGADVILIDSVYLLLEDDESNPHAVKELLKQMIAMTRKGRAVVFTHHYTKGNAQQQNAKAALDRASGSSWWSRFADVLIPLTPPETEGADKDRTLLMVEPTIRHHAPVGAFGIEWKEGPRFHPLTEAQTNSITSAAETSKLRGKEQTQKRDATKRAHLVHEVVLAHYHKTPTTALLLNDLRRRCRDIATGGTIQRIFDELQDSGALLFEKVNTRGTVVALPEADVEQMTFPPPAKESPNAPQLPEDADSCASEV